MNASTPASLWPLDAPRVATPRLELRPVNDAMLPELAALAQEGIHDPALMPFGRGWTDRTGDDFDRAFAQYFWAQRASWSPEAWALPLAIFVDGEPIGVQQLQGDDFALLRTVGTGSWLGRRFQGRGFGTEMRAAALYLAFAGLGAEIAVTGAFTYNAASIRVSEKLGYEHNGTRRDRVRDAAVDAQLFRLTRDAWARRPSIAVELQGLDRCLALFGATPPMGYVPLHSRSDMTEVV